MTAAASPHHSRSQPARRRPVPPRCALDHQAGAPVRRKALESDLLNRQAYRATVRSDVRGPRCGPAPRRRLRRRARVRNRRALVPQSRCGRGRGDPLARSRSPGRRPDRHRRRQGARRIPSYPAGRPPRGTHRRVLSACRTQPRTCRLPFDDLAGRGPVRRAIGSADVRDRGEPRLPHQPDGARVREPARERAAGRSTSAPASGRC